MEFPKQFICRNEEVCGYENYVPAPHFRRAFVLDEKAKRAEILICGVGLYELYINGQNITKGQLAPYFNNPDDILYYDRYDIAPYLTQGENVIGVVLGNGFMNNFGASNWEFGDAVYRSSPKLAMKVSIQDEAGNEQFFEADERFQTAAGPILFDDVHCGEYYDARLEMDGWNKPGFDDCAWQPALKTSRPRGEMRLCEAEPVRITQEIKPVSITKCPPPILYRDYKKETEPTGYLYDFGVCFTGVCRLRIAGADGQEIVLQHSDSIMDGRLYIAPYEHVPREYMQKDRYICKEGSQVHTPSFTYHGFRYVYVEGITEEQATADLLTYEVMHSDVKERGNFTCSDEMVNKLQELTRRASLSNLFYIVTDCPQREKNGWTADAALSSEHMLMNLEVEHTLREWMRNIYKAMNDEGAIPGIVPTSGWGFEWGNGPAWDCILTTIPYYLYLYRGDLGVLKEAQAPIWRYLNYLSTRFNEDGLIKWGLGDWCHPGRFELNYKCPLEVSDSIMSMDICEKAAYIFHTLEMPLQEEFARGLYQKIRTNIRKKLVDFTTMTAYGNCQTAQSMAIFYNVFDEGEKPAAFEKLLSLIHQADDFMDCGVLGARVMFQVLSDRGCADLALKMITRPEYPSYGNWIKRGATALWEVMLPEDGGRIKSENHHFWGSISAWFIRALAGINVNPYGDNVNEVLIAPKFASSLTHAKGYHDAPAGRIEVSWKREGEAIELCVLVPENMKGRIVLEDGWEFDNGVTVRDIHDHTIYISEREFGYGKDGVYRVVKRGKATKF